MEKTAFFIRTLMGWYVTQDRPLPWKEETDPWLILLSEVILQQTRVEQGRPYYERFRDRYPTPTALAEAEPDEVMKLWEGLGYYARARNLQEAARQIRDLHGGEVPRTYSAIRALKGVGDYTAAAVASFAFGLPHAVVDGNVYRVLSRFFGIADPIDRGVGKKRFGCVAQGLLEELLRSGAVGGENLPGRYNQALMDFGATKCKPAVPDCGTCPMAAMCVARSEGRTEQLPVRGNRMERRDRFFNYLVLTSGEGFYMRKRTGKDIWRDLYEFPMIETPVLAERWEEVRGAGMRGLSEWLDDHAGGYRAVAGPFRQELTHQRVIARFWLFSLEGEAIPAPPETDWRWVERESLGQYPFPRQIDWFLGQKGLTLNMF
ncbi:MAG: hypothetical protein RLY31_2960 [Bacteroidota bacterium]|jgi:A/G-specific adenine glycosylase